MEKKNILNKSTINNEKVLLSLPLEKIEEYIQILEEFQNKCEVEAKFVEADLAQKKIAQLLKIKNKKNLLNRKTQQVEERDELERTQKEELDEFNKEQDKKFYELNEKFQEMQNKLEEEHNSQLKDLQQKYEEKYSNYIIKPSPELINLNKKLELYVQKKDYKNAHQTQIDIANLTKKEKEKFEQEKFKTIQKEIENLQRKQLNETKGLELKIQSTYNSFKKNRALKVQELLLKYKNQFRDLENKQSNDIKNLEKVAQGGMFKQGKTVNYSNVVRDKNVNFNRTSSAK
jgi:hypothetical protein